MDRCLVSILMPIFKPNLEWLKIAINSILKQTYDNFELLLLYEPCSDDGVRQLVSEIKDKRIAIIETPPKSGLPKSLNIGLAMANGKYIARMDADDYSLPERLKKQVEYMEAHSNVAVLGSSIKLMGRNEYWFNERLKNMDERTIRMIFSSSGGVAHPTAMFRKSFFDENNIRYNENLRGSEDYYLWVDVICNGGIIDSLLIPLLEYRISDNQASQLLAEKMMEWDCLAKNKIYKYVYGDDKDLDFNLWSKIGCANKSVNDDLPKLFDTFKNMIEYNKQFSADIRDCYNKEIEYWWAFKALTQLKNGFGIKMLYPTFFFGVVELKNLIYIIKRIINTKVINRYTRNYKS